MKVSGHTAYKDLVQKHVKLLANADNMASSPNVVAETILKAVKSNRPKTRYATGRGAKIIVFLQRILPDRLQDKLFLSALNR